MQYVNRSVSDQQADFAQTNETSKLAGASRKARRKSIARQVLSQATQPVLTLEGLEKRTLLSTLPAPVITTHTDISGGPGDNSANNSSPSIAYDPSNPKKLVTVYMRKQPTASADIQDTFIDARYS